MFEPPLWNTQYTLWLFNKAMENATFIDDFPIKTSIYNGFSMALLYNQRVILIDAGIQWYFRILISPIYIHDSPAIKTTMWAPPSDVWWFINTINYIYLRIINHSYWSCLHQLIYRLGARHCRNQKTFFSHIPMFIGYLEDHPN